MTPEINTAVELARLEAQGAFKPNCPAARDMFARELYSDDALRQVFIDAWDACKVCEVQP
jgi:hypothetical protein